MDLHSLNEFAGIHSGHLFIDGVDTVELATIYGTPLYVMAERLIEERLEAVRRATSGSYPNARAVYASKAFQTLDMCRMTSRWGLGLDVVSGGELYAALKAGVDPSFIIFHGNAKSADELRFAVRSNVGRIVSDNLDEIKDLEALGASEGRRIPFLYRITPGVDSHTHRFISTGSLDSKFGIPLNPEVRDIYLKPALESPHLDFRGFHFHVGSQIRENTSHLAALGILLDLVADVHARYGFAVPELNLGGGFAVRYLPGDPRTNPGEFIDPMMKAISHRYGELGLARPTVTFEPGRWIVGEAGVTLYSARSVKAIPGIRTYIGVDGGMTDNIRPALYEAAYQAVLANKADRPAAGTFTIAGKCCESGDILIRDCALPEPEKDDIVAVFTTGAYNHSMASNYNRNPRPAVVHVRDGAHRLSVRRETYEDLVAREF